MDSRVRACFHPSSPFNIQGETDDLALTIKVISVCDVDLDAERSNINHTCPGTGQDARVIGPCLLAQRLPIHRDVSWP